MLERVTLHQTRFTIPGVAPDSRGVLLGREGLLLVASIDRVVLFFRLFGAENDINDLLSGLRIVRVTTPLRTQEFLVIFPAMSSYLMDQAAKLAKMVGGYLFTGTTKHYVAYRDSQAPLGYDARELMRSEADFALYSQTFEQTYSRVSDLDFGALVRRLSLERIRRGEEGVGASDLLYLSAPPGLAAPLQHYLVRNAVKCWVALLERAPKSAFAEQEDPFYLFRIHDIPKRMLRLFPRIPGFKLFYPVLPNVVVEWGYRHPLRLEACSKLFPEDRFFFFEGSADQVEVTREMPHFVNARDLARVSYAIRKGQEVSSVEVPGEERPQAFEIPLRLVPSSRPVEKVMATLVPWHLVGPLKDLVYSLPPELLRGYRLATTSRFIVIMNLEKGKDGSPRGIERLPLGTMMWEGGPSIFLPVGYFLSPRISPEALSFTIGSEPGKLYFFPPEEEAPFVLQEDELGPLERKALAHLPATRLDVLQQESRQAAAPHLINDPVGVFSLWGHRPSPEDFSLDGDDRETG